MSASKFPTELCQVVLPSLYQREWLCDGVDEPTRSKAIQLEDEKIFSNLREPADAEILHVCFNASRTTGFQQKSRPWFNIETPTLSRRSSCPFRTAGQQANFAGNPVPLSRHYRLSLRHCSIYSYAFLCAYIYFFFYFILTALSVVLSFLRVGGKLAWQIEQSEVELYWKKQIRANVTRIVFAYRIINSCRVENKLEKYLVEEFIESSCARRNVFCRYQKRTLC